MNAHSKHDKGDIIMSVVPEIKSPLEEKIVVKPILWTMYHIHAYQGPCRYGQGYALTTEADM